MSRADIRVDVDLPNHPKFKKLRRKLGPAAMECLVSLWTFAGKHKQDGVLSNMDHEDIAIAAGWEGPAQDFVSTMEAERWVDKSPGSPWWMIHDWESHQPWLAHAKERSEQASEAARIGWEKRTNTRRKRTACAPHAERNAPSPSPSPSPIPSPNPKSTSASQMLPPPFIFIPTVKPKGEYPINEVAISEWEGAFPAVNVRQELHEMRAWCIANPERQKTQRGIPAFIVRWLSREQDRGGNGTKFPFSSALVKELGVKGAATAQAAAEWLADKEQQDEVPYD